MEAKDITPFIESIQNVFQTMLQLTVEVQTPTADPKKMERFDVSGIIGLSGDVEGSVVLSFPTATAVRVIELLTAETMEPDNPDFADAVGELVNMISGGAKAKLDRRSVNISCPSVVIGPDHKVHGRKDVTTVQIPCTCDCGEFALDVSFRNAVSVAAATPAADAA